MYDTENVEFKFLHWEDTLRTKRFSTADILFLLFRTVFALGKMPMEIKSKLSAEIFDLKMSLRVENSA